MVVHNTLTGKKEVFTPIKENKVSMYVCGPTTYNFIHLGNARPLVVFDTVRRYLEYRGYEVEFIQNFTDVDDKIIKRSQEEKILPNELAVNYIREYYEDADALGVKRATVHPKVSEHMQEIIDFVKALQEKGFAYEVEGDVYFDVQSFADYGKLSGRSLDDMQAGARVEVDARKKNPADFALWKKAKPGEPSWPSPWGEGRPGWHIECSAMSTDLLGSSIDIHGGGLDLVFPHHENEIAQSEAANPGQGQFVKYWLHNGMIEVKDEKMSKSSGLKENWILKNLLKKYNHNVIKMYILSTHYRSPLEFSEEKLQEATKAVSRITNTLRNI
ncbi:MAG: cysteine--tRNA ligase, partial [Dehalococcoidales bacterium]|nr:cysteine--tRNA ligase [Dehalococcoidales bacterium]